MADIYAFPLGTPTAARADNRSMYWDSMLEHLDEAGAENVSGTVTVTRNTTFGSMSGVPSMGCELRVSWTPLDYADGGLDAGAQVESWAWFLRTMT